MSLARMGAAISAVFVTWSPERVGEKFRYVEISPSCTNSWFSDEVRLLCGEAERLRASIFNRFLLERDELASFSRVTDESM